MLTVINEPTLEEIQIWLQENLARIAEIEPIEVDISCSIFDFGIDSIKAIKLLGQLGDWLGLELSNTLLYEYEDIDSLSQQIALLTTKTIKQNPQPLLNINIAASFTSEQVADSISFWLEKFSLPNNISFAPYNQIFQQLLDPTSPISTNKNGINILLFRLEDWFRYQIQPSLEEINNSIDEFLLALNSIDKQTNKFLLILCPHTKEDIDRLFLNKEIEQLDELILKKTSAIVGLDVLDFRKPTTYYEVEQIFDSTMDKLGHIPFTQEFFAILGTEIVRKIFFYLQPAYKVIVSDCDNTLWQGVCGEDGALGVKITTHYKQLQNFLLAQQQSGKLLALCSKNSENDVWQVFNQQPMILKKESIAASQINWNAKSENLQKLAQELNLGLDSFIFIDDNPIECAEVKANLPEVLVLNLAECKNTFEYLSHYWAFDINKVTSEDKQRTEMYLQNKQREALAYQIGNFEKFLAELNLIVEINYLQIPDLERAAQLTQRTNQFNATTIRRGEADLQELLCCPANFVFSVKVSDRFGDYGFVGLIIAKQQETILQVETFLLSCRVLGKKVEHQMLQYLAKLADAQGCLQIALTYTITERNQPIRDFYQSLALDPINEPKGQILLGTSQIDSLLAKGKTHYKIEPEMDQTKTNKNYSISKTQTIQFTNNQAKIFTLEEIAKLGGTAKEILAVIRNRKRPRPNIKTAFVTSRTPLQRRLVVVWCEVLKIEQIGIYDNFYELGGDSLRSAELVARLAELNISTIPLSLMENACVASMAQAIEDIAQGKQPSTTFALSCLDDEAKLDESIINNGLDKNFSYSLKKIFFTGASGYVGAFLLYELLSQTDAEIYCHVRAKNIVEGQTRVKENLRRYDLWKESFSSRLKTITGNLAEPNLGLTTADFDFLATEIDTIFHNGAWVNFILPYNILKGANISATETILKLATTKKLKPLHFISTLGVLMSGYSRDQILYEDQELDHSEELPNGYEQTKWVADKMVWLAMKKGLPISIYRLGMMSGLSTNGVYHKLNEFLPSLFKGCIQLGAFPSIDTKLEMVPIDFVAKGLIHICQKQESLGKIYHMNHPQALTVMEIINWIRNYGYPLRAIPWDIWKQELLRSGARLRDNALYPFLDFIRALQDHQTYMPEMDMKNFLTGIPKNSLTCPTHTELLKKYFDYFVKVQYLEPPTNKNFNAS
jgi:FkbH-like protein/thioester reductase-like protein